MTRENALDIARTLKHRLVPLFGSRLCQMYVFGSYVRGDETSESDIDIALILDPKYSRRNEWNVSADEIVDLGIENNVIIDPRFISKQDWEEQSEAVYREIRREGIIV